MNRRIGFWLRTGMLCLVCAMLPGGVLAAAVSEEQTFESLQIGATTYQNVTVTSKKANYVFLIHSRGMLSVKVSDLPADVLEKLGYNNPNVPKVQTNGPAVWAKQTIAKLDSPQVKEVQEELMAKWNSTPAGARIPMPEITKTFLLEIGGVLVLLWFLYCLCCMLICKKAGAKAGILIWLPLFQFLPMLKAARMSRWWFLGLFVPMLNLVVQILWCFKIADARNKTALVGFLLLFPITSIFAFLYLAFSDRVEPAKPAPARAELMTLETA